MNVNESKPQKKIKTRFQTLASGHYNRPKKSLKDNFNAGLNSMGHITRDMVYGFGATTRRLAVFTKNKLFPQRKSAEAPAEASAPEQVEISVETGMPVKVMRQISLRRSRC